MSLTSVLLPLPLTPATQMNDPSGKVASMLRRLLARAPRTTSFFVEAGRRIKGRGMLRSPRMY